MRYEPKTQSFSSTDLNKNHIKDTGIVFPLEKANNQANFASICVRRNGEVKLAHIDYRLANGEISEQSSITYEKGFCAGIVYNTIPEKRVSSVAKLFGQTDEPKKDDSYYITNNGEISKSKLINLVNIFKDYNYEPNLQFIIADNLKLKNINFIQTTSFQQQQQYSKNFFNKFYNYKPIQEEEFLTLTKKQQEQAILELINIQDEPNRTHSLLFYDEEKHEFNTSHDRYMYYFSILEELDYDFISMCESNPLIKIPKEPGSIYPMGLFDLQNFLIDNYQIDQQKIESMSYKQLQEIFKKGQSNGNPSNRTKQ